MMIMTNKQGWPSEFTRGYQIADALGCKVNSAIDTYEEPVIAVKCHFDYKTQPDLAKMTNLYVDLIDDNSMVKIARRYPLVRVIVLTDLMRDFLAPQISNEIIVIPEHNCNFEQHTRSRDAVTTVGYVGSRLCFDLDKRQVEDVLGQIGLEFKTLVCETSDVSREDVVDFYKSIDIQLAFRLPNGAVRHPVYRNPLKIFNAGSFKIPTVAYPELSYRLCAGTYFLEALDLASVIDKCYMLKNDNALYEFCANRAYEWSKQFDIAKIAGLYAKLSPAETFDIDKNVRKMRSKNAT